MTDPIETPRATHEATPVSDPHATVRSDLEATPPAVQQLRDAGFADEEQAALTTAFLRVLALWTQQATRDDVQSVLQAGEQRLTQQLDTLRQDFRRELAQQADTLREELRHTVAQQADLLQATRTAAARRSGGPAWLWTTLLGLTCAGVLLLVILQVLGL